MNKSVIAVAVAALSLTAYGQAVLSPGELLLLGPSCRKRTWVRSLDGTSTLAASLSAFEITASSSRMLETTVLLAMVT